MLKTLKYSVTTEIKTVVYYTYRRVDYELRRQKSG